MDLKSTPTYRSSIPLPHCTAVRGYGIFHDVSRGFGDFLGGWRIFVLDTPPKTSIFGDLRIKADQLSHGEDMEG